MDRWGTSNEVSGPVKGNVLQAGTIRNLNLFQRIAPEVRPAQLPPRFVHYVNRERELAELGRFLDGDAGPRTAVVSGIGGVGKSAFGVIWAQNAAGSFTDGQLYADLGRGPDRDAASLSDLLAGFVRAFGFPEEWIPELYAERLGLFRSLTRGKRILVFLDGVDNAEQVAALTPPSDLAVVLATSRWRMDDLVAAGANIVMLEPLTAREGAELLAHRLGAQRVAQDPEATAALVRLCGGLPVVLHVAAARLLTHPGWPVAKVVTELRRRGGVAVDEVVDLSFRELPFTATEVYLAAAVLPGPDFTPDVLAAALGRPVDEDLEILARASLLGEDAEGRFAFSDLIGAHAQRRARAAAHPAVEDVVGRAVRWYLSRAVAADHTIMGPRLRYGPEASEQPFSSRGEALAWLVEERATLTAAVHTAADAGWNDLAWRLAEALWALFTHHKFYGELVSSHLVAVDAAVRAAQPAAEATLRARLGRAYGELGQFEQADAELDRARAVAAEARTAGVANGERLQGMMEEFTGLVDLRRGAHQVALGHFRQALDLNESVSYARGSGIQALHIGAVLNVLGRRDEALEMLRRSVGLLSADRRTQARARITWGETLRAAGEPEEARRQLTEALTVMTEFAISRYQAQALDCLADLAADDGDAATEARLRLRAQEAQAQSIRAAGS